MKLNVVIEKTTTDDNVSYADYSIVLNNDKIGIVNTTIEYDDDGDIVYAYINDINITERQRCKGYGETVLKTLAQIYGVIYLCPENDRCKNLYDRIGENISYNHVPENLMGNYDEYGTMYRIEGE